MPTTLQFRRYDTANIANTTGAVGEIFIDTDKDTVVVQDGSTVGGFPLAREGAYTQANNARDQANTARGTANDSYAQANSARDQANTARDTANGAYGQANGAYAQANGAYAQANGAYSHANIVYTQANNAYAEANLKLNLTGGTISGNLVISGNLEVLGNSTTLNVETLSVEDNEITLNSNVTGAPSLNAYITINRGTSPNANLVWNEGVGQWQWNDGDGIYYSFDSALDSYAQANTARNTANDSYAQANSARDQANTARDTANGAYAQANGAYGQANGAYAQSNSAANTVRVYANSAGELSNKFLNFINTASVLVTVTDAGDGNANISFSTGAATVGDAYAQANAAYDQANTARGTANDAYSQANTARDTGNNAYAQANTARGTANDSYAQANNAYAKANAAYGTANAKIETINALGAIDISSGATNNVITYSINVNTANTTTVGVTKLIDAINSSDTANAATANAAKTSYDTAINAYGQANSARDQANSAYGDANNRVLKAGDTMTGALNVQNKLTANVVLLSNANLSAPSTSNFDGERIRLYDFNQAGHPNYAIGVEGSHIWHGVDDIGPTLGFKWYGNTTLVGLLRTNSTFEVSNTVSAKVLKASGTGTAVDASSGNILTNKVTGTEFAFLNGLYTTTVRGNIAQSADYTFRLPSSGGTDGFLLSTDGVGDTIWSNAIYVLANTARDQANSARDQANTARGTANDSYAQANSARDQANTARGTANDSYSQANTARDQANSAYGQANNAYGQANDAYAQANTARGTANDSYAQANSARDQANTARDQANNAYAAANLKINLSGGTFTGNINVAATLITQNIVPDANVTYSIGTSDKRFKDLWLSGSTIYLGDSVLSAAGDEMRANTFNATVSFLSAGLNVLDQANTARDQANNARNQANTAYDTANLKLNLTGGTVTGDLTVSGNLFVSGANTLLNVTNLTVNDSIIFLANGQVGDTFDIGFVGHFDRGATNTHAGFIRKASLNEFYLFDNYEVEPTNNIIDINGQNFRLGNVRVNTINANSVLILGSAAATQANLTLAHDQANTARNQANTARDTANGAYAQANGAYAQANGAYAQANGAYAQANTRVLKAGDTMTGNLIMSGATINTATANVTTITTANSLTIETTTASNGNIIFSSNGTEDMRITNTGLIGIFTTTPNSNLSITGNVWITTGLNVATVNVTTTNVATLNFQSNAAFTTNTVATVTQDVAVTVDAFTSATFRSAVYQAQLTRTSPASDYETITLSVVHDGTTVYLSQYGQNKTNASANMGTFDASITAGTLSLTFKPNVAVVTVKTLRNALTV